MRVDAERNLELVLTTGARLLATDPSASITSIAATAGVDRRTVYRRFASRDELLAAVYNARYDAVEDVMTSAGLDGAPVALALHRYVEGIIEVNRKWPVEISRLLADESIARRRQRLLLMLDTFVHRAVDEGLFRPDVPVGWIAAVLPSLMSHAAEELAELGPPRAAAIVVDTLLRGVGTRQWIPGER